MNSLSLTEASQNLDDRIDQITENHQPVPIEGGQNDAIEISKEDRSAMRLTLKI